jgi:hypothetical protein
VPGGHNKDNELILVDLVRIYGERLNGVADSAAYRLVQG